MDGYNEATKRVQYSAAPTSTITAEAVTVGGFALSQKKTVEITDYQANALNQYAMLSVDDITDFLPPYDAAGNQTRVKTSTGIWSISYDAENRPTDFTKVDSSGSTSIHCEYDHMGRRATKTVTVNNNVTLHQRYIYRGYLQIAALDLTRAAPLRSGTSPGIPPSPSNGLASTTTPNSASSTTTTATITRLMVGGLGGINYGH